MVRVEGSVRNQGVLSGEVPVIRALIRGRLSWRDKDHFNYCLWRINHCSFFSGQSSLLCQLDSATCGNSLLCYFDTMYPCFLLVIHLLLMSWCQDDDIALTVTQLFLYPECQIHLIIGLLFLYQCLTKDSEMWKSWVISLAV